MVVTVAWTHSWIAVSISLGVLLLLLAFLLICLCYDREKCRDQQYYVLDENGIKRMPTQAADFGFFRRLSNAGVLRPNFRFSTGGLNLLSKNTAGRYPDPQQLKTCERELMDSLDIEKQFTNSVLQINVDGEKKTCIEIDDWRSCISGVQTRRNSLESIRSAMSDPGHFNNAGII